MKTLRSSLRAKLALSFAAVAALFLIAIAMGAVGLSSVGNGTASGYRKAVLANEASARAYNMRISQAQDASARKLVLNPDGSNMHAGDVADYNRTMSQLRRAASSSSDRAAIARIDSLFGLWQQADAQGVHLWQTGQDAASNAWESGTANTRGDHLSQALLAYATRAQKAADANKASSISSARLLMIVLSVIALALAAVIVFLLTRSISRRVGALVERLQSLASHGLTSLARALQAIAGGDLTVGAESDTTPIENAGADEIGRLSDTFNEMLAQVQTSIDTYNETRRRLAEMIAAVDESSKTVALASTQMASTSEEAGRAAGEIASAVGDVATGAERQVQMVDSARSAAEQVAEAVSRSAQSAQETTAAAQEARSVAERGVQASAEADGRDPRRREVFAGGG